MRFIPIANIFWRTRMDKIHWSVSISFYIVYALMLFLLPLKWACAWIIAATVHEIFHIFALVLCRCRITRVHISAAGASIETENLSPVQSALCSLAGPLGSLCLLTTSGIFPRLALCATWQCCYNLLPMRDMDGGRALHQILSFCLGGHKADKLCLIIHYTVLFVVCFVGVWAGIFRHLGVLPILISSLILIRNRKTPCKETY